MEINQFEIWLADLNPRMGTEAGKIRPVLVVQTNLLNKLSHPSTIVCPITSHVSPKANILRVHLREGDASLKKNSDVMIDQVRAIDNNRLTQKLGTLSESVINEIKKNLKIVLDIGG
jgi:mRNA interferase MazF